MYSIIHLSVWTCGYLFYTLGYNSTPHCLFYCWNCPSFSHQELFHLAPVLLTHAHHFWLGGLEGYFLTFWHYKMPILGILCPNSRVSHSSKELQGKRYASHVLMTRKASPKWWRHLSMDSNHSWNSRPAPTHVPTRAPQCLWTWRDARSIDQRQRNSDSNTSCPFSILGPGASPTVPQALTFLAKGHVLTADSMHAASHEARMLVRPVYGCRRPNGNSGVLLLPVLARVSCYSWWLHRILQSINISDNELFKDYLRKVCEP